MMIKRYGEECRDMKEQIIDTIIGLEHTFIGCHLYKSRCSLNGSSTATLDLLCIFGLIILLICFHSH